MTNVGRWDRYYRHAQKGELLRYSNDDVTYKLGYDWLAPCELIEDWGCGYAYFSKFCKPGQYRGVDGSCSPNADEQVDLATYTSKAPGIFMRHVIEHNEDWKQILTNAVNSFQNRMALVLFTPFSEVTHDLNPSEDDTAREFSFRKEDLIDIIKDKCKYAITQDLTTETQFKVEHIIYMLKEPGIKLASAL